VGLPDVHRRPRHRLLLGEPFINDLGIPLNELKWGASCDYEWTASDHISDIHDVWKTGWDDDLGTVPPESLAEAYRNNLDAVERADRTVLHYMQPHAPYLSRGKGQKLKQIQRGSNGGEAENGDNDDGGGLLSSLATRSGRRSRAGSTTASSPRRRGCGSNSIPRTS